jgi:antitoxin MazE
MNTTTIQKWGNSYAVRLPKAAMQKLNWQAGHPVEVREVARGGALSITPVRQRTVSLDEMVSRITKKNQHGITDWGPAVGREVW